MSDPKAPALVFDFGNVVAHFSYAKACERLGSRLDLGGEELLARARQAGLDPLVKRYESGKMTAEEFSRAACELVGLDDLSHDEFAAAWADIFWPNEPIGRLVAELDRAGHVLVLGSNTNDLHAAHFRRQFAETLAHFDALVLSYEVGHVKPAPEFFHACAEAARRPIGDCVFIDDLPENVEGARAAGMTGLVYHHDRHGELVEHLRSMGVAWS